MEVNKYRKWEVEEKREEDERFKRRNRRLHEERKQLNGKNG